MESKPSTTFSTTRYNAPRYVVPYNNPDKKPPVEITNKIFLKAASGRYFDIMTAIVQERSLLNLVDQNNRSVIHHILLNNDLSKNDKYELIKKCTELSAPIDTPDVNGVRPLHLAAGQQNRKLVRYILDKKADPNSRTNMFMTPLHYAVTPESKTCPAEKNKSLIPDNETIIQEFRTDKLFNAVFDLFKNDKIVQMYISHISEIFRNRFVYSDSDSDGKELAKIIKNTIGERRSDNINESVREKLVDFRNTIYLRTKSELGKTLSDIDIKEGTSNGWGPVSGDKNLAILPFHNLKYAYTDLFEAFRKSRGSIITNVNIQLNKVKNYIDKMRNYIINTNNTINELWYICIVLSKWENEISTFLNMNEQVKTLLKEFYRLFDIGPHSLAIDGIKVPDADLQNDSNFNNIDISDKTFLFRGTKTYFNDIDTDPTSKLHVGIGRILEYYFKNIYECFDLIKYIVQQIESAILLDSKMKNHLEIFTNIGNMQFLIINICYILIHFDNYAKHLSTIFEIFRTTITNRNLQPIMEFVSDIINHCINSKKVFNSRIVQKKNGTLDKNLIDFTYYKLKNIVVICFKKDNKYIFAKPENISTTLPNGYYVISMNASINTPQLYFAESDISPGIEPTNMTNIIDTLNNIIDVGGYNHEGMLSGENCVNNLYSSLVDLQNKLNSLIIIYNKTNGYAFINSFNNGMIDSTYNIDKSNEIDNMMFNKINNLKIIPDKYTKFYETYNSMLRVNGTYSNVNALNTAKTLLDTYDIKITEAENSKMRIVREKLSTDLNVSLIKEQLGHIISFLDNAKASLRINGIEIGRPEQWLRTIQFDKTGLTNIPPIIGSLNHLSIINSVFDEHLYIIKLILLMYMTISLWQIYNWKINGLSMNNIQKMIYNTMKDLHDQINDVSIINPLGTVLAVAVKMVEEIYLSTIDNISNLSASNYIKYLATQQNIRDIPFDSLLAISWTNPLAEKSQLITKPNEKVIFKDKDIVLSVLSSGIHEALGIYPGSLDINMLNIFKLEQSPDSETDLVRLVNFDSININNDVCYSVNEDIIGDLLTAGADPNVIAKSGETPLALAIIIQNENIIDTLLQSGSRIVSPNNTINLYDMCFNQLLDLIESSPIMNVNEINTRVSDHLQKVSGMRSIFSNSKLIMKMTAYLFVHQLTLITNTYPNMWNHAGQTKILSMLNLTRVDKDLIPLATIDTSLIEENIRGYSTFNEIIDEYRKQLVEAREIDFRLANSIYNLKNELKELGPNTSYRRSEITQLIDELEKQHKNIKDHIDDLISKSRSIKDDKDLASNTIAVGLTTNALQSSSNLHTLIKATNAASRDVCNLYNIFFTKIISAGAGIGNVDVYNSEYTTYTKAWNDLFARPEDIYMTDHTQMIAILMKRIVSNGVLDPQTFIDIYSPVCELYDKVLAKYGRDLIELMPYLPKKDVSYFKTNYVLKEIYCIMLHVFKHTMSVNFINAIAQLLARRNKGRTESKIMRNVYQSMKSSEFIKYVFETLPKLVIKTVCKIGESEKDPDLSLTVTDILNKSLDTLLLSTFESIDKNTIEQAKEIVVPFFVSYMETYTAEMHMFMVKQCKIMIVQNRLLKILSMLAPKYILEKGSHINDINIY